MDSNDNSAVIEDFEGGTSDDKQTREVKNQMRLAVYAAPAAMIKIITASLRKCILIFWRLTIMATAVIRPLSVRAEGVQMYMYR